MVQHRLYGPDKAKTNFPMSDYATYLGATAGGATDLSNGAADMVADSAAFSPDGHALSAELQALVRPFPVFLLHN